MVGQEVDSGALLPSMLLHDGGTGGSESTEVPTSLSGLDQEHHPLESVWMIGTGDSAHLDRLQRFLLFPEWEHRLRAREGIIRPADRHSQHLVFQGRNGHPSANGLLLRCQGST